MKTIGFVDYYISEWHANNYPVWIKEICEKTGKDFCVKYAWAQEDVSPVDGRTTGQWCEEYGVHKCETLSELCEKSDYILVLAPSNPEKHLEYAREVLKYGKNTYIDKTFAPDYGQAKEIFDIAERYNTKLFSTSALRYADELADLAEAKNAVITGGGSNIEEYIVHQIEMAVKIIREKPRAVKVENQGMQYICTVDFCNDKRAAMVFALSLPYSICADTKEGESVYKPIGSDFFCGLISDILRFYETGECSFDAKQTLWVMRIREAVIRGMREIGEWVEV